MECGTPQTKEYSIIAAILMSAESFDNVLSCMTRAWTLNFLRQLKHSSGPLRKHLAFHSYRYYAPCLPRSLTAVFGPPSGFTGVKGGTTFVGSGRVTARI